MKKFLNLLSVLTISGTAVPTTIAASPYQKEKIKLENNNINLQKNNLNRNKRLITSNTNSINENNKIELFNELSSIYIGDIYVSFTPNFWEEIVFLYINNSKNKFINKFKDKINNVVLKDWRLNNKKDIRNIGKVIHNNFWNIANKFIDSSRKKCIKIKINNKGIKLKFIDVNIITKDKNNYKNKYLDSLEKDFPVWNSNKTTINLGIIEDNNDYEIKNALSKKYPNFKLSNISIVDKEDFSNFCNCFKTKLYVNNNKLYSFGNLRPTLSYITKIKIKEISKKIENNPLVKQWLDHLNDYNKNLPKKIEQLNAYTDKQKWSEKNTEKEIIKKYIKDFYEIKTLIEHEWKIEELNKNIQKLKSNFEKLKNQMNNLNSRIKNLEESTNNCKSYNYIVSNLFTIPIIQQINIASSILSGAVAALCSL